VVHLIRAAMRFVSYGDRKAVAAALKPVYTAANADAALDALGAFEASNSAADTPTRSRPGPGPGSGSPRSWRSRPSCGE
jgi:putative transposase